MTRAPDPRIDEAHARPIEDVWAALGAPTNLRRSGVELVGPCPVCGGRDRFGLNTAQNVFNCRHCTDAGGDQINLVRHVLDLDFRAALAWLCGERDDNLDPEEERRRAERAARERERREAEAAAYRRAAVDHARRIWAESVPAAGTIVEDYLELRRCRPRVTPSCLRFISDHPYVKGRGADRTTYHSGPAMIAAVEAPGLGITAVHQTWLDLEDSKGKAKIVHPKTGEAEKSKLVRGSKQRGAIRLYSSARLRAGDGGELVVGEGIETTLTAYARNVVPGASYWAGIDLGHMGGKMQRRQGVRHSGVPDMSDDQCMAMPARLSRLWFIRDGDSDPGKTEAQVICGLRRAEVRQPGLNLRVVGVARGSDLNDLVFGGPNG